VIENKIVKERLLGELAHFRDSIELYKIDEPTKLILFTLIESIAKTIGPELFEEEEKKEKEVTKLKKETAR